MTAQSSPNFSVHSVHIEQALPGFTIGYHPQGFIAEQVFNLMNVKHETDDFWTWDKGQAFRLDRADGNDDMRADGAIAKLENFGATPQGYMAQERARATWVTQRQAANADSVLDLVVSKINRVQTKVLLNQEIRIAQLCTTAANLPAGNSITLSGVNQWNNANFVSQPSNAFSAIKAQFDAGKKAIRLSTGGYEPNTVVIPPEVARVMENDVAVIDMLKYTHGDLLVEGYRLPKNLWGMNLLIPNAMYTTAVEGEAFAASEVWGKNVFLCYRAPMTGLDILTFGSIFRARDWNVENWYDQERSATFYRASLVQAEKLVAGDCGYLIASAIA